MAKLFSFCGGAYGRLVGGKARTVDGFAVEASALSADGNPFS
jgi:hypothetical protein